MMLHAVLALSLPAFAQASNPCAVSRVAQSPGMSVLLGASLSPPLLSALKPENLAKLALIAAAAPAAEPAPRATPELALATLWRLDLVLDGIPKKT